MSWLATIGVGAGAAILGNLFGFIFGLGGGVGLIGSIILGICILWVWKRYSEITK